MGDKKNEKKIKQKLQKALSKPEQYHLIKTINEAIKSKNYFEHTELCASLIKGGYKFQAAIIYQAIAAEKNGDWGLSKKIFYQFLEKVPGASFVRSEFLARLAANNEHNLLCQVYEAVTASLKGQDVKNYISALLGLQKYVQARDFIENNSIEFNDPKLYHLLGNVYYGVGDRDRSEYYYQKSLALKESDQVKFSHAVLYMHSGGERNAKKIFQTIKDTDLFPDVFFNLVNLGDTPTQLDLKKAIELADSSEVSRARSLICFGLAHTFDRGGDLERAVNYFNLGNDIERVLNKYSIAREQIIQNWVMESINLSYSTLKEFLEYRPIFIVGMPRTGTSIVERKLSERLSCPALGELTAANHAMNLVGMGVTSPFEFDLERFASAYVASVPEAARSGVFIDKMPFNFRWINFLKAAFPNCTIINCRRGYAATAWSLYSNRFLSDAMGFSTSFEGIRDFFRLYEAYMGSFKDRVAFVDVNLEEFVENPERILDGLDLPRTREAGAVSENISLPKFTRTASAAKINKEITAQRVLGFEKYVDFYGEKLTPAFYR